MNTKKKIKREVKDDESEEKETWTLTVEMTVFAGDMEKENVISEAERLLPNLLDGTDFMGVVVIDAKRDE